MMDFSGSPSVKISEIKNCVPRFRIRASSERVKYEIEESAISSVKPREGYSLLIPSQPRVLCRGKEFFCKFWEGVLRWLEPFLARLPVSRIEQPSQHFSDGVLLG